MYYYKYIYLLYHSHSNRVCIYSIQIVINKQIFPYGYGFNGTYKNKVSFTPLKYAVGLLNCRPWLCIVYKPRSIPCGFWPSVNVQHCYFILIFVESAVNNLLTIHIYTYFMYIGLDTSNTCSCNRVQHTPSILYICRNRPLCHPCKTTPNHVMTMVQFNISSHSHKTLFLVEENPWVPIISLDFCTSMALRCHVLSHYHSNMAPLQRENISCVYGIFFWYFDI